MSAQVAIAKAANYDLKLVRQQVQALLDGLGGLGAIVHSGDRVAIKINLTGGTGARHCGDFPIESYVTHPAVQALGELVQDAGGRQLPSSRGL
jgi:uncharacterized protein (DUF362 family)